MPSLLKTFTTSKTPFVKKGGAFKEAGFQVRKMTKPTSRMLEEEGDRGKEDAILLAKVSGLNEGIAIVVDFSVARLLRDFFVLYRHRPRYRTNKEDIYRCLRVRY